MSERLERYHKLIEQEGWKDTNRQLALYIQSVMQSLPLDLHVDVDDLSWRESTDKLHVKHTTVSTIEFFHDDGKYFFKGHRFGFILDYSATVPENFIEYRDTQDRLLVAKRIWSRFGFSLDGRAESHHFIPDRLINGEYQSPRDDLSFSRERIKNFLAPVPLDDPAFQENMVKISAKPTAYDYGGGYVIDITIFDGLTGSWGEYVFDVLKTFSEQNAERVPDFIGFLKNYSR